MNKYGRAALIGTTFAVLIAGLGACGSDNGSDRSGGTITFRSFDPPAEVEGLKTAVEEWNSAHDVKVEIETVAVADALAQYTREAGSGSGPDVSQLAFTWTRNLGEAGLLEPLQDRLKGQSEEYLGLDLNSSADGSKIFGVPWSVDTFALAFDPAVLKGAGVTVPTTWEELATTAKKLTTSKRAGFCFAASSGPTAEIWHLFNAYLWSHGTALVEGEGADWKPAASQQDLAEAFSYVNAFFTSGSTPKSMLSLENAGDPAINGALAKGECALAFMSPAQVAVAVKANPALITAPMPAGSAGTITHLGGRSLGINPKSKHVDAAWEFVRFLTTREFYEKHYSGQFPAQGALLKAIAQRPERAGFVAELPTARTYVSFADTGVPVPEFWTLVVQELGKVNSGQLKPDRGAGELLGKLGDLKK